MSHAAAMVLADLMARGLSLDGDRPGEGGEERLLSRVIEAARIVINHQIIDAWRERLDANPMASALEWCGSSAPPEEVSREKEHDVLSNRFCCKCSPSMAASVSTQDK